LEGGREFWDQKAWEKEVLKASKEKGVPNFSFSRKQIESSSRALGEIENSMKLNKRGSKQRKPKEENKKQAPLKEIMGGKRRHSGSR